MPGPAASVYSPFCKMRDAAGKLDHFKAALHVAARIRQRSFRARRTIIFRKIVHVFFNKFLELEHHPRPALRIGRGPVRKGFFRRVHRLRSLRRVEASATFALHLACGRIKDVMKPCPSYRLKLAYRPQSARALNPWRPAPLMYSL